AVPIARGRKIIIAGGLRPENVARALDVVRPYGVDVSSGVEREPGMKDPRKIREFLEVVREWEKEQRM
ncbi:MAG TPA: N-(5'-phosphoribosyl)anthranilate isomerase, partial [Armatimonadetes bacterium]|nr:N-(5'-phosphoribosyl)anthranilate isomerase [Armatimonadota bacterium]